MRGFTSVERNNLNPVLVEILIKGRKNSCLIEMTEIPIILERTCIILSMEARNFSPKRWL